MATPPTPSSSSSGDLPLHRLSVGDTILIYWDSDRKWYPAEITGANGDHGCEILYLDGERERVSLDKVKFIVQRERSGRSRSSDGKVDGGMEGIKTILFDIEDRLPLEGVFAEDLDWWKTWHDDVVMVVVRNDVKGLMDAILRLVLQLKPSITSSWWAKHSDGWKKRLKLAGTIREATLLVKDLRDNAIGWSSARKLFSENTGASDGDCSQHEDKGLDSANDERPNRSLRLSGRCHDVNIPSYNLRKCSKSSISSVLPSSTGNLPVVACRRSNRLKKVTVEMLSSKNSTGDEIDPEPPFSVVPSTSCSNEGDKQDSAPQRPNKSSKRKHTDRDVIKDQGLAKGGNSTQPNKKGASSNSNFVHLIDGDRGHIDEPLDERSSDDSTKSCTFSRPIGLPCSICQIGVCSDFLVQCKNSDCFRVFHTFCLHPPLQKIEEKWLCPYCDEDSFTSKLVNSREVLAKKIQRIVGRKQVMFEDQKRVFHDEFLVKWESLSHHYDSWVPREWLYIIDRTRLHSYLKKCPITTGSDSIDERKPEWFKMDRVIACRRKSNLGKSCDVWKVCPTNEDTREFEFLVKWKGLDYSESTWVSSCEEELLAEVGRLVQRHQRAAEWTKSVCASSGSGLPNKTPNDLYGGILYDYQIQGLNWILSNFKARRNVILADEMGLGKTVQVVSFVNCMKQEKLTANPVLIIAPKSILFQWEKEFSQWAKELNVIIYQGEKQSRRCIQMHEMYTSEKTVLFDALVTNYEMVILDCSVLKRFKWSAIIIDEAHKIKRLDCKLSSYLKRYSSDFRLLLTGTPLQNTLLELFALLHFIDPEQFSDPVAEAESFNSIKSLGHTDINMKIAEIHAILRPLMLRRMKSDVLSGSIPVKKWVEVPCALADCQRELYINILEKNYEKLNREIHSGKKIVLNFILMQLRKCCNHPYLFPGQEVHFSSKEATFKSLVGTCGKLQLLEKLLPKLKERGNRVLLFSQMTMMLDILEDFLTSLDLPYFRIDGSTPVAARQQQMKDFNAPESQVFIFLISTRAGGLGMDLPTADRVIIYDPDFNPFMDLQAQSRAHRIGQTRPVVVYQLITKCSVEEKILQKSKQKLAIENLVMNPSKKLTEIELHSVLLHGARTILNRKMVKATAVVYDEKAIETLLKLDPAEGESCSADENGYLGSIHSFMPGDDDNEGPASPKAADWEKVLGPVQADVDKNLGKGKRQKKAVNYESDAGSDSDDIYSPEGSSDGDSSSDDSGSETNEIEMPL